MSFNIHILKKKVFILPLWKISENYPHRFKVFKIRILEKKMIEKIQFERRHFEEITHRLKIRNSIIVFFKSIILD